MHVRNFRQSVRQALAVVLSLTATAIGSTAPAQSVHEPETRSAVGLALEQLPRYGVFDFLAFHLDRGAVTLEGYAYGPQLGSDATAALKGLPGVDEVADKVQRLPVSATDERVRWITFYQIYTDGALSRYAPGGATGARFDAFQFGGFPGTQPSGYAIHVIVKGGRTTLAGVVDNASDRHLAGVRAREVPGAFAVVNQLVVIR
jgi:hypothetical protein